MPVSPYFQLWSKPVCCSFAFGNFDTYTWRQRQKDFSTCNVFKGRKNTAASQTTTKKHSVISLTPGSQGPRTRTRPPLHTLLTPFGSKMLILSPLGEGEEEAVSPW